MKLTREKTMNKIFRAYYVWPNFPSISMSGNRCELSCKHCNHTYLDDMVDISNNEELLRKCHQFKANGCIGFLLSGGCDKKGKMLNLKKLLPTIKQIKNETNLIIKLHTGILDKTLSEDIVSAGIDIASVEVVGSNDTIKDILNFKATIKSYESTLQNLELAGIPYIVPHICIGLQKGKLNGEFNALKIIKESCNPSLLVFIIFRPTKGTNLEYCNMPSIKDISSVMTYANNMFPNKDLSLGCIRPRLKLRNEIELAALNAGINRMEIPSKTTIEYAKKIGYEIKNINACCALPEELEYLSVTN